MAQYELGAHVESEDHPSDRPRGQFLVCSELTFSFPIDRREPAPSPALTLLVEALRYRSKRNRRLLSQDRTCGKTATEVS